MGYVFRSGKTIHFVDGLYATGIKSEIDELTEVCIDSPNFYIDEAQVEVSEESMSPIAQLKAKYRAEWEAEQRAAIADPNKDLGNTVPTTKLGNITTSATLSGAAVASGSAQPGTQVLSAKAEMSASAPIVVA